MWFQMPSLSVLLLDHNMISRIDTGAFASLPQLLFLQLSHNQLQIITPAMFLQQTQMERLNLEGNNIQHILPGTFAGMTKLQALWLGHNNLTVITDDMFTASRASRYTSYCLSNAFIFTPKVEGNIFRSVSHYVHSGGGGICLPTCPRDRQTFPICRLPFPSLGRYPSGHVFELFLLARLAYLTLSGIIHLSGHHFSDSTAHPQALATDLGGNPLECGSCMCWIKQAEREGWLSYRSYLPGDGLPDCVNYDEAWEDVDLGCVTEWDEHAL